MAPNTTTQENDHLNHTANQRPEAREEINQQNASARRHCEDRPAKQGRAHERHGGRQNERQGASQPSREPNQGTEDRGAPERAGQRNKELKEQRTKEERSEGAYRCNTKEVKDATESPNAGSAARLTAQSSSTNKQVDPSPRGYIIQRQKVSAQQYEYVEGLLARVGIELSSPSGQFYCHVLVSSLRGRTKDRGIWNGFFVPVYCRLITESYDVRSAKDVWQPLHRAGLIDMTDYDPQRGLSREYRAKPHIYERFVELGPRSAQEKDFRNLFNGRRTVRRNKSKVQDGNGNAYPDLIKRALKMLEYGRFDDDGIQAHLNRLKARRNGAYELWEMSGHGKFTADYEQHLDSYKGARKGATWQSHCRQFAGQKYTRFYRRYLRIKRRFINDRSCYSHLLTQEPEETDAKGIYKYPLAYRVQGSGRIGQIGGALQSCSREMKHAAYGRVRGTRNYDRKGSQPCILIQRLEEAEINASWLRGYRDDPNGKHNCANFVGVDVSTWKRCFCALLTGASLPQDVLESEGSIAGYLLENVGSADPQEALERLCKLVLYLKASLDAWHEYLVTDFWEANKEWGGGGPFIRNATGMRFYAEDIKDEHERKRKMAAFILQGAEAAHIHHLTLLQSEYDYTVIANEHDGLVVLGEIPDEAKQRAMNAAGLKHGDLVEKPIC